MMLIRMSTKKTAIVCACAAVVVVGVVINGWGRLHALSGGMWSGFMIVGHGWPWVFLDRAYPYDDKGIAQRYRLTMSYSWSRAADFGVSRLYVVRLIADLACWTIIASGAGSVAQRCASARHKLAGCRYSLRDLMIVHFVIAVLLVIFLSGFHDRW